MLKKLLIIGFWMSVITLPNGSTLTNRETTRWDCVVNTDVLIRLLNGATRWNNCGNPVCYNMNSSVEDRRNIPSDDDLKCDPNAHDGAGN